VYKAISKQLNLDERQEDQLKRDLESTSWLYSDSTFKRASACFGYVMIFYIIIYLPVIAVTMGTTINLLSQPQQEVHYGR
jgi:hypothetical protein